MRTLLLVLLLSAALDATALGAVGRPAAPAPAVATEVIRTSQVYYSREGGAGDQLRVVLALHTAVVNQPQLDTVNISATVEECSARCRAADGCDWFTWCGEEGRARPRHARAAAGSWGCAWALPAHCPFSTPRPLSLQGGCADGTGGTLPYLECHMLGESCTMPPLAASGSAVEVTSGECRCRARYCPAPLPPALPVANRAAAPPTGFPLRYTLESVATVGFSKLPGQAIEGADFPCAPSLLPGKCAADSLPEALLRCYVATPACKAVVFYAKGAVLSRLAASVACPGWAADRTAASVCSPPLRLMHCRHGQLLRPDGPAQNGRAHARKHVRRPARVLAAQRGSPRAGEVARGAAAGMQTS